jgi:phospholipid/cholesterol/gamma-HCH transport system permease protein
MAAEISSMRITEQLDALRAFGLDEVAFVGSPRIFASLVMLPILTVYSFVIGIGGGYLFVVTRGIHGSVFLKSLEALLEPSDIFGGLLKAAMFGVIIATTACAEGFRAENGAIGVGEATTRAVVWSNMLILTFNYILSTLLFGGVQ